ncbi:helix-turn-helix domain-containing protein [Streptomyces afghaniensis]
MKELAGRLTALDPDAGAAVRVIAYFDRLAETRAGVEALVRGAAVLSGCPARLVDPERRVHVRVEPDGTRRDTDEPPDPAWPSTRLAPDGTAALWLERVGAASGVVDTGRAGSAPGVTETSRAGVTPGVANADHARAASQVGDTGRAGAASRAVDSDRAGVASPLGAPDRTAPAPGGVKTVRAGAASGLTETSRAGVTPGVANADRTRAASQAVDTGRAGAVSRVGHVGQARVASSVVDAVILERAAGVLRLVLDRTRGRVPADDPALVETLLDGTAPEAARLHAARRLGLDTTLPARALAPLHERPRVVPAGTETDAVGRLGVGPAVPVLELPRSWAEARTALRFTAEGTPQDPGPRVVHAEELGGIALLADLVVPGAEPPPDVRALETAAATTPWLPATLHAVAATTSLRAAATEINVHHSTLQDRLAHAEHLLGWPVRTPQGRLRLQLALAMRHLARPEP